MKDSNIPERLISEHDVTRVMPGDIESVRNKLIPALEQLGYRVVNENPIKAKHAGRRNYYTTSNVLDCPTRLDISLKSQGQVATQIIFDYQVQHGAMGKGDRHTLTCEAEAIVAVANQRTEARHCSGCGVIASPDSRFCRKCGTPLVSKVPAELEVMRLIAGTRAGYQWTTLGICIFLFATFFPLMAFLAGKALRPMMIISAIVSIFGAWVLGTGLRGIHRTLNSGSDKEELPTPTHSSVNIAAPITDELPLQYSSITEGTTNLLPEIPASDSREREKIPS